jgi:hypothetical protein
VFFKEQRTLKEKEKKEKKRKKVRDVKKKKTYLDIYLKLSVKNKSCNNFNV